MWIHFYLPPGPFILLFPFEGSLSLKTGVVDVTLQETGLGEIFPPIKGSKRMECSQSNVQTSFKCGRLCNQQTISINEIQPRTISFDYQVGRKAYLGSQPLCTNNTSRYGQNQKLKNVEPCKVKHLCFSNETSTETNILKNYFLIFSIQQRS